MSCKDSVLASGVLDFLLFDFSPGYVSLTAHSLVRHTEMHKCKGLQTNNSTGT